MENRRTDFVRKVYYRDVWIRAALSLVGAHWVVAFGEPETIFELFLMWDYWRSLAGSWLIAFTLLTLVRWICLKLDARLDWQDHPVARSIAQVGAGVGLLCLVAYLLAAVYFMVQGLDIRDTLYIGFDWPLIIAQLFICNLYYLIYYVVVVWKKHRFTDGITDSREFMVEGEASSEVIHYRKVFIIQVAAKNIPIATADIAYFYRLNEENFLRTFDGEDYVLNESLEYYEQAVDPDAFFRANRQFLVAFKACQRFEVIENDKLELFVDPSFKERINISQKRAPVFRRWLDR